MIPNPLAAPVAYPVYCAPGVLTQLAGIVETVAPAHRYAIITDDTVSALYGTQVQAQFQHGSVELFAIPPGEREKTRTRWAELTDTLLTWGAGRDTTVIALGGGVIGDLAGFVAATFMRGIPVVQVPTTLLAMVDASVGGKTAIDTAHGKNVVGAFHDPRAVVIDPSVLRTLPAAILRSGMAEVIKHGVIADAAYFDAAIAASNASRSARASHASSGEGVPAPDALESLIAGSIMIKARVVAEDAGEAGLRHILNFGHTIAHAIERELDYGIAHGDAVAIGMVAEARLAERLGLAAAGLADSVVAAVQSAGLPTVIPSSIDPEALVASTKGDKKARSGSVRYALPVAIGSMYNDDGTWSMAVADLDVLEITRFGA